MAVTLITRKAEKIVSDSTSALIAHYGEEVQLFQIQRISGFWGRSYIRKRTYIENKINQFHSNSFRQTLRCKKILTQAKTSDVSVTLLSLSIPLLDLIVNFIYKTRRIDIIIKCHPVLNRSIFNM